jgi:hypothetical protein
MVTNGAAGAASPREALHRMMVASRLDGFAGHALDNQSAHDGHRKVPTIAGARALCRTAARLAVLTMA